ncbi:MAG: cation diffusion facilitator family transporter, partial [Methanosarcinales archaeon]|nr:cation diffusion facilitator family transporter [Methanosarcinales archaeon]
MIRLERDKKAALVSIGVSTFLAVVKYLIGILSGSIALIADAIHSLTDVISSIGVFIGLKISSREPTKEFPYGFYKTENIASLFLALAIFYAGYEIILTSIEKFEAAIITNILPAISVALLSVVIAFLLSRYKLKVGRELNSPSLIADGQHTRSDALSSVAVFLGLVGYYFGFSSLDAIAGILVSVLIFRAGYEILKDSVKVLLDASIGNEELNRIREVISEIYGVREIHYAKARSSGKFMFIELDIHTNLKDLERAHQLSDKIEERIKTEIKNVDRVIVHMEPEEKEFVRYAVPCTENNGMRSKVSGHFGVSQYFCVFDIRVGDNEPTCTRFIKNPYLELDKRRGL